MWGSRIRFAANGGTYVKSFSVKLLDQPDAVARRRLAFNRFFI
jgi:hypothetical protein